MTPSYDRSALEASLSQLESTAIIFAQRSISDGKVREVYIRQTKILSQEYRAAVATGKISAKDAATQVQLLRNEILEVQRLRSSDIGRAKAVGLKKSGLKLSDLAEKYAKDKFGKPFVTLSDAQKNFVYLEIVESAGRPRTAVTASVGRFAVLARGLIVVTIGIAVYNISMAEDKSEAVAREGVVIGGGVIGGAAGGAVAGLACGPGAPVCVTVGVFLGGVLGAMGTDVSFGWFLK